MRRILRTCKSCGDKFYVSPKYCSPCLMKGNLTVARKASIKGAKIAELRRKGKTFTEIGQAFHLSRQRVYAIFNKWCIKEEEAR